MESPDRENTEVDRRPVEGENNVDAATGGLNTKSFTKPIFARRWQLPTENCVPFIEIATAIETHEAICLLDFQNISKDPLSHP